MNELQLADKAAFNLTKPEDINSFSIILQEFIKKSELSTSIQGKKYCNVDGWKFAGLNFGLVPIVGDPVERHTQGQVITILYHEIEKRMGTGKKRIVEPFFSSSDRELSEQYREKFKDKIVKSITTDYFNYKCGCDVVNTITGVRVGAGFGMCSNLELAKSSFDEFAVMSMAQTRAIGRAFKNVIGFIMKSAGYAETPTEEMDGVSRNVALDESTVVDIESALMGCSTEEEIVKLWHSLDAVVQSNRHVVTLFKNRKAQIKANEAATKNK